MPNWSEVLHEIVQSDATSPLDEVRGKYLARLSEFTNRNLIAYYSGWLQSPGLVAAQVNDDDKNGLMATIHGLDRTKGLDILLHTPGGDMAATESIVDYLRAMFGNDLRAIIPQISMSAGTMIACACNEIVMGKQSNIGPIDPQFNGIPAHGVIEEFEEAVKTIKTDPASIPIWQTIVGKYHPTFLGECNKAIELAGQMVEKWLLDCMFHGDANGQQKAKKVVGHLNNHADTMTHSRHIHVEEARSYGLKIKSIEDDFCDDFQDLVLTCHHAFMHTFANTKALKLIENQNGQRIYTHGPPAKA